MSEQLSVRHSPRCAIFSDPPGLRSPEDCTCGAIPPLHPENASMAVDAIPQLPQTQRSLESQLTVLRRAARRLGLYDADDFLGRLDDARIDDTMVEVFIYGKRRYLPKYATDYIAHLQERARTAADREAAAIKRLP